MPEFLNLLPPDEARERLLSHLLGTLPDPETIESHRSLGRVTAADVISAQSLPEFARSTVDGYAVLAMDTHGASDSLPVYLSLVGEVPMGDRPPFGIEAGQCALIHTGGMLPHRADSVVMLEHSQLSQRNEVEIFKSVAAGENLIRVGEDVNPGQLVLPKGTLIGPAEIGGLMALGLTTVDVARKPWMALISTGDEVVEPAFTTRPGQVRDINSYTLAALIERSGGMPVRYGIVADDFDLLLGTAARALSECDAVIITAGSSASTRDMTAEVVRRLGEPGVLVHGINTRPGKPTILGVCDGKAVIGLPGNPVSALVNGYLFVVPVIEKLTKARPRPRAQVLAKLTVNLPSQAGREDWWPVKLIPSSIKREAGGEVYSAEPIFGKSNLIFTLAAADGLLRIQPDATGLSAGMLVEVMLL